MAALILNQCSAEAWTIDALGLPVDRSVNEPQSKVPQTHQLRANRVDETFKHLGVTAEPVLRRAFPFRESGKRSSSMSLREATELSRWVLTCLGCVSSREGVQPNGTLAMLIPQRA